MRETGNKSGSMKKNKKNEVIELFADVKRFKY